MTDAQHQHALALLDQGRLAEGALVLRESAQAGHVPSIALLGAQLLAGRGMAPDTIAGIRLIIAAADRGDANACALAATVCARGFSGQPDWPRALDYLQRSAELGFEPARAQLRLLSGYKAGIDWKKLRRAIDIAAWRKVPAPVVLSEDPAIRAAPGLLSPELCDALIARAQPSLAPAKIYNELKGGRSVEDARQHSAAQFPVADSDLVMLAVCERLAAFAGLPAVQAENGQVLHYEVGEYFAPHFDFFEPGFGGHVNMLTDYGQRVATVLVYLNDDLEGGETDFPRLGIRHRGRKGDGLMFRNVDAEGKPHPQTLHAGLPPTRGRKWLLSLWIRDRTPPGYGAPRLLTALAGQ